MSGPITESGRRALKQVRVLWPYLDFDSRYQWVDYFRMYYEDDFTRTVEALSGFAVTAKRTWQ